MQQVVARVDKLERIAAADTVRPNIVIWDQSAETFTFKNQSYPMHELRSVAKRSNANILLVEWVMPKKEAANK